MPETFKIGDFVCLITNPSTKMAIDSIDNDKNIATCVWLDKNSVPHKEKYNIILLKKYKNTAIETAKHLVDKKKKN